LAVRVLEGNCANTCIEVISREAGETGAIGKIGCLAKRVELLAQRLNLVKEIASVALNADSSLIETFAEGILLLADDAVSSVESIAWVAGKTATIGVIVVA
jgi:hypothetical protein